MRSETQELIMTQTNTHTHKTKQIKTKTTKNKIEKMNTKLFFQK